MSTREAGIKQRVKEAAASRTTRQVGEKAKKSKNILWSVTRPNGTMTIRSLEQIADGLGVSFSQLVTGRASPAEDFGDELTKLRDPSLVPAVNAFLDLYDGAPDARDVVRALLNGTPDRSRAASADEWFDHLRAELRRRRRGIAFEDANRPTDS